MSKTLKITDEVWKKLSKEKLKLMQKEGKSYTFSEVINKLFEREK